MDRVGLCGVRSERWYAEVVDAAGLAGGDGGEQALVFGLRRCSDAV